MRGSVLFKYIDDVYIGYLYIHDQFLKMKNKWVGIKLPVGELSITLPKVFLTFGQIIVGVARE